MGCNQSSRVDPEKLRYDHELDMKLEEEARHESDKFKLLLLGAGESGKSTIFKQMKVIYGDQYSEDERRQFLQAVYINILQAIQTLCTQTIVFQLDSQIQCPDEFNYLRGLEPKEINIKTGNAIKIVWNDPVIQTVWRRRSEYQIIDSVKYYFERIDVIKAPDYVPDKDDIIHTRVRTSGIVSDRFIIDNTIFELYDVGGQRNERKKWIHCFEGVTAVIFVAAISEYDQTLFEDMKVNRMAEALHLFEEVCNNPYFKTSSMILFLNKSDLYAEKIKVKNIKENLHFADFSGPEGDYEAGIQYFLMKFVSLNKVADRQIYHHVTCATDTRNVRIVFDACKDIILRNSLKNSGFVD